MRDSSTCRMKSIPARWRKKPVRRGLPGRFVLRTLQRVCQDTADQPAPREPSRATWQPDDAELEAWDEANRDRIAEPEYRKVQMVMLNTEQQANETEKCIDAGEITMYQAASDHSVAPDAETEPGRDRLGCKG